MARFSIVGEIDIYYVLVMNLMRDRVENATEIRRFDTLEELQEWYKSLLVSPYSEEGPSGGFDRETQMFNKTFLKGSDLEWFNPLREEEFTTPNRHGQGVHLVRSNLDIKSQSKIG